LELVKAFTEARREAFAREVLGSSAYLALRGWLRELGLTAFTCEVLPTTWELYLLKGLRMQIRVRRLAAKRSQIRRVSITSTPVGAYPALLPEEFSSEYVFQLGELLGYPRCCVERFVQDRVNQTMAEERASEEIRRFIAEGREIDLYAYFVKDFFPCSPICGQARAQGERVHRALSRVSPDVGDRYVELLRENLSLVERYPEVMRMHREKLQSLRYRF